MSSSTPDGPVNDGPDTPGTAPADDPQETPAPDGASGSKPEAPRAAAADEDEPQDVTLLVDPDRVRRAPKYPVFLWVGALVGAVVGLIFSTWLIDATDSAGALMKPGVYVSVTILGGIAVGLGVAGLIAVISDRRSLRRR
ncbi:hypothetical protein [Krasilnikoviella flava]|uniref:Uncharacterized protein n=1 Tax=Krasilnikoviella flava TaxID=526729 RepID=A0A1T5LHD6_9MICO|nr:hypothetical protein [Krasilnikoviella flava]SKC75446.1 hypothetical protein SAMN04324258_3431 [Krasilnikoviella flava]